MLMQLLNWSIHWLPTVRILPYISIIKTIIVPEPLTTYEDTLINDS
jgi:hypothetical protein